MSPRWVYLGLVGWIPAWLFLAGTTISTIASVFAGISLLPLLLPLRGVLQNRPTALIWGAYASLPAFLIGVMESWSNPPARPGALVQLALVVGYWILVMLQVRRQAE